METAQNRRLWRTMRSSLIWRLDKVRELVRVISHRTWTLLDRDNKYR
jgi:hypothetical protein